MRTVLAAMLLALIATVAGGPAANPPRAHACSLATLMSPYLPEFLERTPIVVIGTWSNAGEYEATLTVETALKGATPGEQLRFDNRGTYTAMACSPYDEEFHSGHRFVDGQRSLVFLEKQVDGLWQIGWSSHAAYPVPADEFEPLPFSPEWPDNSPRPVALDEVRARIAAAPDPGDTDLATLERSTACREPYAFSLDSIENYTQLADAVAIITITSAPPLGVDPGDEVTRARVDEVLRGELAATEVTLNDRGIGDYETKDCIASLQPWRRGVREGQQFLAFLRADEFGVAELRPVAWGQAIVAVNERYVTSGQLSIAEVRRLVGAPAPASGTAVETPAPALAPRADAIEPTPDAATPPSAAVTEPAGDSRSPWLAGGLAAAGIVVVLAVVAIALRVRQTRT